MPRSRHRHRPSSSYEPVALDTAEEETSDSKLFAGILLALGAGALAYAAYKSWMVPAPATGKLGAAPAIAPAPALFARAPVQAPVSTTTAIATSLPPPPPPPIQVLTSPPATPLQPTAQATFPTRTFTTQPTAPQNPPTLTTAPPVVSTRPPTPAPTSPPVVSTNPPSPTAPPVVSTNPPVPGTLVPLTPAAAPTSPPILTIAPAPTAPPGTSLTTTSGSTPTPGTPGIPVDTGTPGAPSAPPVTTAGGGGGGGGGDGTWPRGSFPYGGSTVLPSGGNPQPNPCVPCDVTTGTKVCPPADRVFASALAGGAVPVSGGGIPPMSAIRDDASYGIMGAPPKEEPKGSETAATEPEPVAPRPTVQPRLYWPD